MKTLLLSSVLALLCVHCTVNEGSNIAPPTNGTPDPGKPPAGAKPGEVSQTSAGGSRLSARYLKTSDNAEFFQGIFDSKLGTMCDVTTAADGAPRCLPSPRYLIDDPELHYADAGCTQSPLGSTYPFASDRYGFVPADQGGGVRMFERTSKTPVSVAKAYRRNEQGACVEEAATAEWYPLREVQPAEFVDGTLTKGADKSGVMGKTFAGTDGSKLFVGYFASVTDTACVVVKDSAGIARCLPGSDATPATSGAFSSNTCSGTEAALVDFRASVSPRFVTAKSGNDACGLPLLRVFSATPSDAFRRDDKGVCSKIPSRAVAVGGELAPSIFPAVTESAPWGTGRIRSLNYAVGMEPVALRSQFDTARNEGCAFTKLDNGETRCIPFALRVNSGYFADSACSTEAVGDFSPDAPAGCKGQGPKYYLAPASRASNLQGHIYELTKLASGTQLYARDGNGACVKSVSPQVTHYQVGTEVPLTSFELATNVDR